MSSAKTPFCTKFSVGCTWTAHGHSKKKTAAQKKQPRFALKHNPRSFLMSENEENTTEQESDSVYTGKAREEDYQEALEDGSTDESKTNSTESKRLPPNNTSADSKETKWVKLTKMVVITFLVLACISSAAVTYIITSNAERNTFEKQVSKKNIDSRKKNPF